MLADLWGLIGRPSCILPDRFGLVSESRTIRPERAVHFPDRRLGLKVRLADPFELLHRESRSLSYPASVLSSLTSSLSRLLCGGSLATALHQEHGEVRGERLCGKLPHH
jgi:hypothetical protein